jgi:hypothetical protein
LPVKASGVKLNFAPTTSLAVDVCSGVFKRGEFKSPGAAKRASDAAHQRLFRLSGGLASGYVFTQRVEFTVVHEDAENHGDGLTDTGQ